MSTIADNLRLEWYLTRFSWHMQDYPQRAYRRIRDDLRRELTAAAADVGMPRAVADLGKPRMLADGYISQLERPTPRWATGAAVAALAIAAIVYLGMAYSIGAMDTLEALGGGSVTMHPLGSEATFISTDEEVSAEATLGWSGIALLAGLGTVAFTLGSRAWRAIG